MITLASIPAPHDGDAPDSPRRREHPRGQFPEGQFPRGQFPTGQLPRGDRLPGSSDLSDEDLLARVSAGDKAAFTVVFARYAPRVKAYLMRLGATASTAEDLAQDVMVNVWRRAGTYEPARARPSTWIFVIARNAWIDRLRRERVELAYRTENPPPLAAEDETPDDAAARRAEDARIAAAIALLSEEQRQVVRLAFFEDRAHSEIAFRLALPLGTVKSRLRLALAKLRNHWEQFS